ncbi:cytochrome P450 [Desarmillaria tabescens]|uniref:Cytochrome P450 n=1 Tax=Armillaria tabescens TaxID=1929756 RepID=A0AA39T3Z6_ARMTA|nr:cytochrome P450 [Desarmillaria tabescens]KAK0462941.1 cytochrome P450 [Desarmillaria tabescens]
MAPRRNLAIDSVKITIASLLGVFDFGKAVDEGGKTMVPSAEYTSGMLSHWYQCSLDSGRALSTSVLRFSPLPTTVAMIIQHTTAQFNECGSVINVHYVPQSPLSPGSNTTLLITFMALSKVGSFDIAEIRNRTGSSMDDTSNLASYLLILKMTRLKSLYEEKKPTFSQFYKHSYTALYKLVSKSHRRLLPGPPGLPIIGNVYDIPGKFDWIAYMKMSRKYDSGLISLNFMGSQVIVVNTHDVARDLFEKCSLIYSDKFAKIMSSGDGKLVGAEVSGGKSPVEIPLPKLDGVIDSAGFKPSKVESKPSQAVLHPSHFGDSAQSDFGSARRLGDSEPSRGNTKGNFTSFVRIVIEGFFIRRSKAIALLPTVPVNFVKQGCSCDVFWMIPKLSRNMFGRLILAITYGIDIKHEGDPYIRNAETAMQAAAACMNAGSFLVDASPILRFVPDWFSGTFKHKAKEWRKAITAMPVMPVAFVKQSIEDGTAEHSVVYKQKSQMEADGNLTQENEDTLRDVTSTFYAGGADTTVSVLCFFVLATVLYPNVQKKGQAAIDMAIGSGRLPDFYDCYLERSSTLGARFTSRCNCGGQCMALLREEAIYGPDTDTFNPERFMKDGALNLNVPFPMETFGFGRRICPGKDLAINTIKIVMASLLAVFDFGKAVDAEGNVIEVSREYLSGALMELRHLMEQPESTPLQSKENKPEAIENSVAKKLASPEPSESDCEEVSLKEAPRAPADAGYDLREDIVIMSDDGVLCNWSRGLRPAKVGTPLPPEIAARVVNLPRSEPEEDSSLADDECD